MSKRINLQGMVFERLTVLEFVGKNKYNYAVWNCRCSCGNTTQVTSNNLINKHTRSCGCLRDESKRTARHGYARRGRKGPTYCAWVNMVTRILRAKEGTETHKNYPGRGITICERWLKFENFLADMGEKPSRAYTLERKDNSKGYFPGNCVWATHTAQSRNRRSNHLITYDGQTKILTEWAEQYGIKRATLDDRLRSGWSIHDALTIPVSSSNSRLRIGHSVHSP